MRIEVNGRERRVDSPLSVADLLQELGIAGDPVAVAVNREVVPKGRHDQKHLKEGDQVEIIQAVAGG